MNRTGLILACSLLLPVQAALAAAHLESPAAVTTVSAEEFAEMKRDMAMLLERFETLAAENAELRAAQQQTEAEVVTVREDQEGMSWAERIKLSGDFRYRYQNDQISDNLAAVLGDKDSRNRQRIRARALVSATLSDDLEVGLGLASGGEDPVSANQTLGGGGSSKPINLDMAYVAWSGLPNTTIRGGKVKNNLERAGSSQLQWDNDWRPEGADVRWDNGMFFGQFLGTWLESDSERANSEFAYIAQAGTRLELAGLKLKGGVGYTEVDAAGKPCFFDLDDFAFCGGNQLDGVGNYLYDFEVINLFAEAGFSLFDLPVTLFADFVKNDAADELDTGYLVGAQVGEAKGRGSWEFEYD